MGISDVLALSSSLRSVAEQNMKRHRESLISSLSRSAEVGPEELRHSHILELYSNRTVPQAAEYSPRLS
jgi:hypothetical protein